MSVELSEQELIQAGYVSGENTLVQEINQIPAGMFLVHEKNPFLTYRLIAITVMGSNLS